MTNEINFFKDKYCSYCGSLFHDISAYPRRCVACQKETYLPAPSVGIGIIPINDGLLVIRRNIPPSVGGLALPGGYKNVNETWEMGISREVFEETGILVNPDTIILASAKTANNGCVLVFGISQRLILEEPVQFTLDHETQEALILTQHEELCFPHHDRMSKWFWESLENRC